MLDKMEDVLRILTISSITNRALENIPSISRKNYDRREKTLKEMRKLCQVEKRWKILDRWVYEDNIL